MINRSVLALGLSLAGAAGALTACSAGADQPTASIAEPLTELADEPEDFTPTSDGEVLDFGDSATVVTTGFDTGAAVYWEVTVEKTETLTHEEIKARIGQDPGAIGLPEPEESDSGAGSSDGSGASPTTTIERPKPERYAGFTCFVATFTPVGKSDGSYSVTLPKLTPVDPGGVNANFVPTGNNEYCGVSADDEVPAFTGDMEIGREYKQAVVTWKGADDPGIVGTGVALATEPSPRNTAHQPQYVRWE
ncbi:hypothetical protein G7Y29_08975 [Corynebacterium qintianiae]|uniref:Uncharacterized protein n=1 Tax=Corynebacterium qintianiae TaxID=2709392 RepID=A0A7T0KNB2_9CORY|nr:hypothetical protein [Corynebacterium qintianiae]QPK82968.1 hypothetical protein G7Y29_08975 [Corynebacterium qintianiae]